MSSAVRRPLPDTRGLLVVSLPANDPDLARSAVDNGADVVKVHVNLTHASRHEFGTLADNRAAFEQILDLGVPVGIVPGAHEAILSREELRDAERMGFAFCNADISAARPYFTDSAVEFVPSIGGGPGDAGTDWLPYLRAYPGQWIEASAVDLAGHRQPLRLQDLLGLRRVGELTGRRIVVPSVRTLVPHDLGFLFAIPDVWAVMIGAYVTGLTAGEIGRATRSFRTAIDDLRL